VSVSRPPLAGGGRVPSFRLALERSSCAPACPPGGMATGGGVTAPTTHPRYRIRPFVPFAATPGQTQALAMTMTSAQMSYTTP
jgi:hypothetical protein